MPSNWAQPSGSQDIGLLLGASGMSMDVTIGTERLAAHPLRAAVLGEVHARPFTAIETPHRVLHFAFETTGDRGEADRLALIAACAARGLPPLPEGAQEEDMDQDRNEEAEV